MCSPEEVALLRLEEVFLATLARINNLVLQPLLTAGESQFSNGEGRGHRNCPRDRTFTLLGHLSCSFRWDWGPGPQLLGAPFSKGP